MKDTLAKLLVENGIDRPDGVDAASLAINVDGGELEIGGIRAKIRTPESTALVPSARRRTLHRKLKDHKI